MDKIIHIHKADPIVSNEKIDDITLIVDLNQDCHLDLKHAEEAYRKDALKIMDVLNNHVPQGTRYHLLLMLLEKAKIFYKGK